EPNDKPDCGDLERLADRDFRVIRQLVADEAPSVRYSAAESVSAAIGECRMIGSSADITNHTRRQNDEREWRIEEENRGEGGGRDEQLAAHSPELPPSGGRIEPPRNQYCRRRCK